MAGERQDGLSGTHFAGAHGGSDDQDREQMQGKGPMSGGFLGFGEEADCKKAAEGMRQGKIKRSIHCFSIGVFS
jgi:hypothetical protein